MAVVSREMIEVRAYEIWEQEGRPHGRDVEHWMKAAEELEPANDSAPKGKTKAAVKPKTVKSAAAAAPVAETKAPAKPKRTPARGK
jgi:hypothetical protein